MILIATGSEVALGDGGPEARCKRKVSRRGWCRCRRPRAVRPAGAELSRRGAAPAACRRVAVEAGVSDFWRKYVGLEGGVVGIDRFGESAPAGELFKFFGFTSENVVATVKRVLHS